MRALAYLLGARALDTARGADTGIGWPRPEEALGPLATTEATAAAWRRWRNAAVLEAALPASEPAPSLVPKRA
jgi:hypothetical protein